MLIILAMLISLSLVFYAYGWKTGLLNISFIASVVIIYTLVIKYFGQEGKEYFAYFLVILAIIVMALRKKSEHVKKSK